MSSKRLYTKTEVLSAMRGMWDEATDRSSSPLCECHYMHLVRVHRVEIEAMHEKHIRETSCKIIKDLDE